MHILDSLQADFVDELEMDQKTCFLDFNFAPLALRRDIAMLAVLHKRVLGISHEGFADLFPFAENQSRPGHHNKQIRCAHVNEMHFQQFLHTRSLLHLTLVYNRLPQRIDDLTSISEFQHELTEIAKARCASEREWIDVFSPRIAAHIFS